MDDEEDNLMMEGKICKLGEGKFGVNFINLEGNPI
jgi:hypothetical protein